MTQPAPKRKFLDRLRDLPRAKHYSYRTEEIYVNWVKRYILFHALERKYFNAERNWIWQYVFPASCRSPDPRSGVIRRHHLDESVIQKAVKAAAEGGA